MPWSLRTRVAIAFAAGIVLLAVVSFESYRSTVDLAKSARWTALLKASADPQLPAKVRALGADDFLSKPVDYQKLEALLAKLSS